MLMRLKTSPSSVNERKNAAQRRETSAFYLKDTLRLRPLFLSYLFFYNDIQLDKGHAHMSILCTFFPFESREMANNERHTSDDIE